MAPPSISNFGAYCIVRACGSTNAVAAGTGDATAVTGATIDRLGYGSGKAVVSWRTTLAATKTLSLAVEYQDSADGTTWNTAVALQASTVMKTGAATDSVDEVEFSIDFAGLQRYIRINFTPDLSNTATDTVDIGAVLVLGGAETLPAA